MPFEDKVPAIFHLLKREVAVQIDRFAFFFRELGSQGEAPIVQPLTNDVGTETIRCRLQRVGIGDCEEGVVVLTKGDAFAQQFLLNEVMAIDPKRDGEGKERTHTHGYRA